MLGRRGVLVFVTVVAVWLWAGGLLWGQATLGSATVSGTVADSTGAVVPGVRVVLTSEERGLRRETAANEVGLYVFPDVSPGRYDLRASHANFETYELKDFRVEVGQRATINVKLNLGQVTTVVTVGAQGETILLETESNSLGTVVDSERVNELPLNGRNFLQLALLAAASNEASGRANAASQVGHPGRAVVIGGNKSSYTGYTVNGIAIRGARLGELALNLSIANIDQFKVQQSFFLPDQGPNPSLVNVTTKGGTNQFHGQAFEFLRNVELDARNFFAPGAENLKRNQFGFSVGGPIVRDKVWFYGGYEGLREITGFSRGAYTPTQRMFGGDFTEVSETIHDPLTFSESSGRREPFPNTILPPSRINPISKQLLRYYLPGSSLEQRPNNLFVNPRDTLNDDQFNLRIDAFLTAGQGLFGQFIHSDSPAVNEGLFPLSGAFYPNEAQLGMIQHTYTIRPALVSTLRAGFSRNVALFSNEGRNGGNILGPLGITNTSDVRGLTSQGIQGFSGFGRANGDLGNLDNNYQIDGGMNWIKGSHQFRFGTSIRYRRTWQQNANAGAHGSLGYQPTFSAQLGRDAQGRLVPQNRSGHSFADFLLGLPTTGSTRGLPMLPYRFTQHMPYFQDTWKVTRNFTVNYGISWFKDTIPDPQGFARNFPHGFDSQTGLLKFAALGEVDPKVIAPDNNNFAPRLGFAWQVGAHTVIRAGAGVYYSDQQLIELQFSAVGPPFNRSIEANNGQLRPVPVFELGKNIFPAEPLPALDQNFARNLPAGEAPFLLAEDGRTPYVSQWNVSVQQTVGSNDVIELSYLGNSGHRLQNRYDFDQCRVTAELGCNPATRPYPRYASLLRADFNGNSSYNAFVARYQHRVLGGANLRFEYTWAKGLLDNWEDASSTNSQITSCRRCDKDHASYDVRHRAVVSAIWDLPFLRGRGSGTSAAKAAQFVLGGWTVTTITTFSTGVPFLMTGPNRTGSPFVDHRPNRWCDGRDSRLAGDLRNNGFLYFDTSCFAAPNPGFFGNSSRAPLHGPGLNNWDVGIQKFFPVREAKKVQFRAEMFNAFNHTQFGGPNGNAGAGVNFGRIGSARAPRLVQLGLKFLF